MLIEKIFVQKIDAITAQFCNEEGRLERLNGYNWIHLTDRKKSGCIQHDLLAYVTKLLQKDYFFEIKMIKKLKRLASRI